MMDELEKNLKRKIPLDAVMAHIVCPSPVDLFALPLNNFNYTLAMTEPGYLLLSKSGNEFISKYVYEYIVQLRKKYAD